MAHPEIRQNIQIAPWPIELEEAVLEFRYKPGWMFRLISDLARDFEPEDHDHEGPAIGHGTTLDIISLTYNSYRDYEAHQPPDYRVHHYKIVPPATFKRNAWERWILDQCIEIEIHEACEFARFVEGQYPTGDDIVRRPFAPLHGPGENPYVIHEYSTDEQRRTSFRGELKS